MKKIKYYLPFLIWIIVIFIMSNTNGIDSSNQSGFITGIILKYIHIDHNTLSFIIRKMAHMSEYAILFLLSYYALIKTTSFKYIKWMCLCFCFLYACSDEFHQLFIIGRSGQFKDVMIDTCGALIMLIIISVWQRKKSK